MSNSDPLSPTRRNFLATTSGVIAGAVAAPHALSAAMPQTGGAPAVAPGSRRKIPIGVFDPAFPDLTLDHVSALLQPFSFVGHAVASSAPTRPRL